MSIRPISARYIDPLSHIWLSVAAQFGLRISRNSRGYATTDGQGLLTIALDADLDADDCLAQIVLHELCHALVQGEQSFAQPDWGLENDMSGAGYKGDTVREQACLRVQAALLRPYGLRGLLGPTTEFRAFYDRLPADPLADPKLESQEPNEPELDIALTLAREGVARAMRPPFLKPLQAALRATAEVHAATARPVAVDPSASYNANAAVAKAEAEDAAQNRPGSLLPALWQVHPPVPRHPSGLPMSDGLHAAPSGAICGTCIFAASPVRGKGPWRCHRTGTSESPGRGVPQSHPACALYRSNLDCQVCAACCRHAYDLVPVTRRESVVARHPHLIEQKARLYYIRRNPEKGRCAALDGAAAGPYRCTIYADRPATCRDFAAGSASCVEARRRVGLECGQGI